MYFYIDTYKYWRCKLYTDCHPVCQCGIHIHLFSLKMTQIGKQQSSLPGHSIISMPTLHYSVKPLSHHFQLIPPLHSNSPLTPTPTAPPNSTSSLSFQPSSTNTTKGEKNGRRGSNVCYGSYQLH